jgi:hypothetical protein
VKRPTQIPRYADACLKALSASGLGGRLSLGGAFGLAHYFEYRSTRDLDAWWVEPLSAGEQAEVIRTTSDALVRFGQVRVRSWGDVVSIELAREGKVVFSFQIARRSTQLARTAASPWRGIRVDSLADLVASKMVALVERGAPRDFRDIYSLCRARRSSISRCWELWKLRQLRSGEDASQGRARVAIRTHLARIEQARPLSQIADLSERDAAGQLREWFVKRFLHGLED